MNIGVIVYSKTGHTLAVATRLKEALSAVGHTATLEQAKAAGPVQPGMADVPLEKKPETDAYDALVFCSPVWGGTMASPMASYLEQISSLQDKKVACLATHIFPPGVGGNQTLAQMKDICESKGATVCGVGSVNWLRLGRERKIAEVIDSLSKLF